MIYDTIQVEPIAGAIGAEIYDIDLAGDISEPNRRRNCSGTARSSGGFLS